MAESYIKRTKVTVMKQLEHIQLIMTDPIACSTCRCHAWQVQYMHVLVGHVEGGVKSVPAVVSHVGAPCMTNERPWHITREFAAQLSLPISLSSVFVNHNYAGVNTLLLAV